MLSLHEDIEESDTMSELSGKSDFSGDHHRSLVFPVTERSEDTGLVYPVSVVVVVRTEKSKFSMKDNFSFKK